MIAHLQGSGKGSSPPPPYSPVEDPNTLQSKATWRVIDLIGEGENGGLVNGAKSIFLKGVQLQADDGGYNFQGVQWEERVGLPDQTPVKGFPSVETSVNVGVEVSSVAAVTRTITNPDLDAVRVHLSVPALFEQFDNGDLKGSSIDFKIEVVGHSSVTKTISGKTMSTYERNIRVELPTGSAPWDIKVTKLTADSQTSKLANTLNWISYTEILDQRFIYPDSHIITGVIDSQLFGGQVPDRAYEVYGRIVKVPSNYDPLTRVYTGLWDGTFKLAWTDNPAWCYYDMLEHDRYGLGLAAPDKWSLYPIAQYCDGLVDDGFGGQEPRFTLNCCINNSHEAYELINTLASVFRGMPIWTTGTITTYQDAPEDSTVIANPANILGGFFSYEGTSRSSRHTVAYVTWNDPANGYKPTIEPVVNRAAVRLYGHRPTERLAFGCISQGMAHRVGSWLVDSENSEKETVVYRPGPDHAFVMPGQIVDIADPWVANARMGGRLKDGCTSETILLDAPVMIAPGESYTITVIMPDGNAEQGVVTNAAGDSAALTLAVPLSTAPKANAVFVVTGTDVAPRTFRILNKVEIDQNTYQIIAVEHDPTKYARIENNLILDPPSYSLPGKSGPVMMPGNAQLLPKTYYADGQLKNVLVFSWEAPADDRVNAYLVQYKLDDGNWQTRQPTPGFLVEKMDVQAGHYYFRVQSLTPDGGSSAFANDDLDISQATMPDVTGLVLVDGSSATEFTGGAAKFAWDAVALSDVASQGGTDAWFQSYVVEIVKDAAVVRTEYPVTPEYTYTYEKNTADGGPDRSFTIRVYQKGNLGQLSTTPAALTVSNPAPSMAGFTPTVNGSFKGVKIDWSAWSTSDADVRSFKVYLDNNADPSTLVQELSSVTRGWSESGLDVGVNYKVKIVPVDAFGVGTASGVANGTPVILTAADVDVELAASITMSDSMGNSAATLAKLYDRNLVSDGVSYALGGADKFVEYCYGLRDYIDRLVLHTDNASGKAYVAYSDDGATWSWLQAEADHTLTATGELVTAASQVSAQGSYWQLGSGLNVAIFPQRVTAKYCRIYLTGTGYTTTLYELQFVRQIIAEMAAFESLSSLSANLGSVTAGLMQSQNFNETNKTGMQIDLDNSTMKLFGSGAGGAWSVLDNMSYKLIDENGIVRVEFGVITP